ncbi:phenylacetate--CoA ligase family protein [Zhouia sp. PK063]|uniref:phenylacetate--CoA ligase family protein n=1 Tax=Zhouia sp. PK063 TaxID=3373602 RepID=UPI0037AB6C43
MFRKWLYHIGVKLRNPSLPEIALWLKKTERWNRKQLELYQLIQLKELLKFSNDNSLFYNELFKEYAIDVTRIKSLKDLDKLPVLNKEELLKNCDRIQSNFNFKKTFKAATSGSTGTALNFKRDEFADSFNRASIQRGYSWHGVAVYEKNGYLWGFNFTFFAKLKTTVLDLLQNRFRLFSYNEHAVNPFLKKLRKASYLSGYSSMLYHLANKVLENGDEPYALKMVKGTSEKIFPHYASTVKKAFGVPIISEYGATETGIIAFECAHGRMHLNMEGVIVEEVDHQIVVTNLQMKSFPIIRYALGDYIALEDEKVMCTCGMQHRLLKEVTGRVGEQIFGKTQVYPSLYFYYVFKNLSEKAIHLDYQIIQREKGKIEINLNKKLTIKELENLQSELHKYFKDDLIYDIDKNQYHSPSHSKQKSFISYL